ncbi:tetratricopeptide repeat protein, partial [candidate division KSB1 bacterium]|nr:tetratricopeptide repeat protein [candidate division KSB1 bacterium]NIR70448.1 tetratricopeptide repeat protein [candidate division KSB1 bacterium]NIS23178.1 tetratricopeptide repeat protein [candidate division KSB1 bacterium]NIT70038.1 tetratricopeptide repeat protein [candidate division KSB1 bacterium]NIU23675.1 tetratricopeptide repeat protein [candidate division KSB1 bacterium]
AVDKLGMETVLKLLKHLNEKGQLNERQINILGYKLLNNGRTDDAIDVFKLNVAAFPNSANTYDSLGEAYMKAGMKEPAIQNYKKSLELNPDNSNAVAMLKRLND